LAETVIDIDKDKKNGNGFHMKSFIKGYVKDCQAGDKVLQ